jgi:hypothetical protein
MQFCNSVHHRCEIFAESPRAGSGTHFAHCRSIPAQKLTSLQKQADFPPNPPPLTGQPPIGSGNDLRFAQLPAMMVAPRVRGSVAAADNSTSYSVLSIVEIATRQCGVRTRASVAILNSCQLYCGLPTSAPPWNAAVGSKSADCRLMRGFAAEERPDRNDVRLAAWRLRPASDVRMYGEHVSEPDGGSVIPSAFQHVSRMSGIRIARVRSRCFQCRIGGLRPCPRKLGSSRSHEAARHRPDGAPESAGASPNAGTVRHDIDDDIQTPRRPLQRAPGSGGTDSAGQQEWSRYYRPLRTSCSGVRGMCRRT